MVSLIQRGLANLIRCQCRVTTKATRSVSYVAESLSEDYGKRQTIESWCMDLITLCNLCVTVPSVSNNFSNNTVLFQYGKYAITDDY